MNGSTFNRKKNIFYISDLIILLKRFKFSRLVCNASDATDATDDARVLAGQPGLVPFEGLSCNAAQE